MTTTAARREQRRREHAELSRAQLLDAAEDVFARKGFFAASLKEIADVAGFAVGSVYSFFDSKDDLFQQVFARRGREFMPGMRAALAQRGAPMERLHALVDFQVGFFRRYPLFGRLYLRYSSTVNAGQAPHLDETVSEGYDDAMRMQSELFADGQRRKVFRPGDPEVLSRMLSGLVFGYQSVDPAVVSDEPSGDRLPLAVLHQIIERAFGLEAMRST